MARGGFHHIDLNVSNVAASKAVYDPILTYLGYALVRDDPEACEWDLPASGGDDSNGASIGIKKRADADAGYRHRRYAPGLHHLAWRVSSRDDVDRFHDLLKEKKITVLDPPAHYPEYSGDYYAVFFEDPDGIKLEVVYAPGW
ncbi:MAG: VOC family protein, partial [Pseudomonadota bacterium]